MPFFGVELRAPKSHLLEPNLLALPSRPRELSQGDRHQQDGSREDQVERHGTAFYAEAGGGSGGGGGSSSGSGAGGSEAAGLVGKRVGRTGGGSRFSIAGSLNTRHTRASCPNR